MLRPAWGEAGARADVGVALITATVISLAVFVLQILDENRLQRDDSRRQDELSNQALRLQLGISSELKNMDLHGQDLRAINLPQKHLEAADFSQADLSDANLEGAHLENASFFGANLQRANLRDAHLEHADLRNVDGTEMLLDRAHLAVAKMNGAQLMDAELYDADFQYVNASGANLKGARVDTRWKGAVRLRYDRDTVFPNGRSYPCPPAQAPCILPDKASQSRRR
jgi:uncharacterized protein YjbI with pentapeptide repeats